MCSHFTKLKTQIIDVECLERALEDLNISEIEHGITIKDYYGQERKVDIGIRKSNLPGQLGRFSDLGFVLSEDGTYEMVIDGFYQNEVQRFTDSLTQRYAYRVVCKQAEYAGYTITGDEVQPDGTIRLEVVRW